MFKIIYNSNKINKIRTQYSIQFNSDLINNVVGLDVTHVGRRCLDMKQLQPTIVLFYWVND